MSAQPKDAIRAQAPNAGTGLIVLPIYLVLLVLTLVTPVGADFFSAGATLRGYLLISLATVIIHLSQARDRNWMRIDTIFLLGYFIVYYQWVSMIEISRIIPQNFFALPANSQRIVFGTWLATLGLITWAIGYAMPTPRRREVVQHVGGSGKINLVFGLLLVAFVGTVGGDYLTGAIYRQVRAGGFVTMSGVASYVYTLLSIVILILAAVLLNNLKSAPESVHTRTFQWGVLALIAYCALFSFAGERGAVVQVLSAIAVVYCSSRRPLGLAGFFLATAAGALVFTIAGLARADGATGVWAILEQTNPYTFTLNLANSARAFFLGIDIVNQRGELFWGQLWLGNLLAVVPFAQNVFVSISEMSPYDINSAYLIAYYRFGPNPHTSDGSTMLGDIYMNFGTIGVLFFMTLYGAICRRVQAYAAGGSGFYPMLVAVIFASFVFYISRSTYLIQLRPVIWGLLLALMLVRVKSLR